jgi:hypothetical protein
VQEHLVKEMQEALAYLMLLPIEVVVEVVVHLLLEVML